MRPIDLLRTLTQGLTYLATHLLLQYAQIPSFSDCLTVFIDNPKVHPQMLRQRCGLPGLRRHRHPADTMQLTGKTGQQLSLTCAHRRQCRLHEIHRRHIVAPHRLGHGLDQGDQLLLQQAGHQPFKGPWLQLYQQRQRDEYRHPIARVSRFKVIHQWQELSAMVQMIGEGGRRNPIPLQ